MNKIRKPYKFPVVGYALICFVSIAMSGISVDLLSQTHLGMALGCCFAFSILALFCGIITMWRWNH